MMTYKQAFRVLRATLWERIALGPIRSGVWRAERAALDFASGPRTRRKLKEEAVQKEAGKQSLPKSASLGLTSLFSQEFKSHNT
jgi:hypothetical protein